mgnify:CR=1 FL=1
MNWLLLVLMVALFFTGMPIVLAVGLCSLIYAAFIAGVPLTIVPQQAITAIDSKRTCVARLNNVLVGNRVMT